MKIVSKQQISNNNKLVMPPVIHIYNIVSHNATCLLTSAAGKKRIKKWTRLCRMNIRYTPANSDTSKYVSVIKGAHTNNVQNILIFTDDAKLVAPPVFTPPPEDYDVLYFGGRVQSITQHTTSDWKKGVFLDANFVVISKKAYAKILRESGKSGDKTLDVVLSELSEAGKIVSYCLNPQIVSTYSAERESRTNLYDLTEAITGYPVAEPISTVQNRLVLITKLSSGFNETMFTCLLYSLLKDTYPKDHVTWIIAANEHHECFNALANSGIRYKILLHLQDNIINGMIENACVTRTNTLDEGPCTVVHKCIVVHYECGYYYRHNYLSVVNASLVGSASSMMSTVSTYVYVILTNTVHVLEPVDVSGYSNILIPGILAYTINFWHERPFDKHESLQQFVSQRESQVSVCGDTHLAIKIIGNTDTKLKDTNVKIESFYDSDADQTFLECVYHTYN